jgi:hypothetical protein
MGTRSTIALEFADGTVQQVYCHWDGYLDHNGKVLQEHYSDPFKLRDLIDLGDISSLGKVIGKKHPFGPAYNETDALKKANVQKEVDEAREAGYTTFYARDRGETGVSAKKFKSIEDYYANVQGEEYDYILSMNWEGKAQWYVRHYATGGTWIGLEMAFEQQAKETA